MNVEQIPFSDVEHKGTRVEHGHGLKNKICAKNVALGLKYWEFLVLKMLKGLECWDYEGGSMGGL